MATTTAPGPGPLATSDWPRRILLGLAALLACGVLAYGCSKGQTGEPHPDDPVVIAQIPGPDARALRQTEVGAELQPGWDGRLTIDGIAVPEGQMEGAVDPKTTDPVDLKRYGLRPNNRNHVFFVPGPGKVIEEFTTGQVHITLRYFPDRRTKGDQGRVLSWVINVD